MFDVADASPELRARATLGVRPADERSLRSRGPASDPNPLIVAADGLHASIGSAIRTLFSVLVEFDQARAWEDDGARDLTHWVQMRYGISAWKAHRWVEAARAIDDLPEVGAALTSGELGPDKVVELTRFATPGTERGLVAWAATVSAGATRRRAEVESRRSLEAAVAPER